MWQLSGGTPLNPQQETIIGVAVTANDPRLTQQMLKIAGKGYLPAVAGNKVTFFVSGLSGS